MSAITWLRASISAWSRAADEHREIGDRRSMTIAGALDEVVARLRPDLAAAVAAAPPPPAAPAPPAPSPTNRDDKIAQLVAAFWAVSPRPYAQDPRIMLNEGPIMAALRRRITIDLAIARGEPAPVIEPTFAERMQARAAELVAPIEVVAFKAGPQLGLAL